MPSSIKKTPVSPAHLIPLPHGPYEVSGPLEMAGRDGEPIQARGPKVYLCRCGLSADKPFCDGSHAKAGWKDDA